MVFRFACRPVSRDADSWAALLFGRAGRRAARLSRLRGSRLAEALSAEALCLELTEELLPGSALKLDEDEDGKPFIPGCPLFVSLSHSGGYAAAAVSDLAVGIDLQELRKVSDGVLRRVYSPEEQSWVSEGDRTLRAIRLWTMKEAYGKLTGSGIFGDSRFCASFTDSQLNTEYGDAGFLFPDAPEGLLLTVCLARQPDAHIGS